MNACMPIVYILGQGKVKINIRAFIRLVYRVIATEYFANDYIL